MDNLLINSRVCPKPVFWNQMYNMLVVSHPDIIISKPLILAAWNFTSDFEKQIRFKEHLSFVDLNFDNQLITFLNNLTEDKWHHLNE